MLQEWDDDLQDRVLVPDDKLKSMAWWVSRQQYCQSVFNLFYDDKKNWTQSALNESQTVQACHSLHGPGCRRTQDGCFF